MLAFFPMTKMMKVYSIDYEVRDASGKKIDASEPGHPMMFMEGSRQIIPALEEAIKLLKVGEKKDLDLKASEAYGNVDKTAIFEIPLSQLPPSEGLKIGDHFWAESEEGGRRPFRVTALNATHATMDGNHPLAGMDLSFTVKLIQQRDATEEEMAHGHAHGPGGHHH